MGQPANATVLLTNKPDGQVWIALPNAGTVWVGLECEDAPAVAQIWHQGGAVTPIAEGAATYQVGAQDALVYALANPDDSIKLVWAYV